MTKKKLILRSWVFDCEGKDYIALTPKDDTEGLWIYGYESDNDGEFDLIDIDNEIEYQKIIKEFATYNLAAEQGNSDAQQDLETMAAGAKREEKISIKRINKSMENINIAEEKNIPPTDEASYDAENHMSSIIHIDYKVWVFKLFSFIHCLSDENLLIFWDVIKPDNSIIEWVRDKTLEEIKNRRLKHDE